MEIIDSWPVLAGVIAIYLLAGTVKGVIGVGLPLISVPLLTLLFDVPTAIALMFLPLLVSNFYQMLQGGHLVGAIRRFWPLILAMITSLMISAQMLQRMDPGVLVAIVGCAVIFVSLIGLLNLAPTVPPRWERPLGAVFGLAGGLLGGMTSFYGLPVLLFITALRLDKGVFVGTMGMIYFVGTAAMYAALTAYDLMTVELAALSAAFCLPVLAGMAGGILLRRFVSQELFRRMIFSILLVIGATLVGRSL